MNSIISTLYELSLRALPQNKALHHLMILKSAKQLENVLNKFFCNELFRTATLHGE